MIITRKHYNGFIDIIEELRNENENLKRENFKLKKENAYQRNAFLEELAKYNEDGYIPVRFEFGRPEHFLEPPKLKIMYEKKKGECQ